MTIGYRSPSRLVPSVNCASRAEAKRAAVLVDAAAYFSNLKAALRNARQSIFIVGWDFDARIRLTPQDGDPQSLGDLLRHCVEARPSLHVHVLVWSVSIIHGPSAIAPNLLWADWQDHPRIHFKLDSHHPLYASHHQKIVCIDGALAFVGGIDLTVRRWDDRNHQARSKYRVDEDGEAYPPVHDIQMLVDGDAAAALCGLARQRWRSATGDSLEPPQLSADAGDPWPADLVPDFRQVLIAVSRTVPAYGGMPEVAECGVLTADLIAAARNSIYIEAQYLSAPCIGAMIEQRLQEPNGPDVLVIMTYESRGLVERLAMGMMRDRLLRRLAKADSRRRLRVMYPVVPDGGGERQVIIHAKLMIVDDELMRIGSSNLNSRSIGLDTECDLTIEAATDEIRATIAGIRDGLLAEHLDVEVGAVADMVAEVGSLAIAVDRLNTGRRGLKAFPALTDGGPARLIPGYWLLDPTRPFNLPRQLRGWAQSLLFRGARREARTAREASHQREAGR
jgi:phosphatidylserine/phosphatidylglycerophosphate/cardiolipin synthase-like enzyme